VSRLLQYQIYREGGAARLLSIKSRPHLYFPSYMKSHKSFTIPFLLFFLSLLLRLSLISKGPFNGDCLGLAITSETLLNGHQLNYLFGSGLPMTIILGAFFVWITKLFSIHDPVFAVNLMSVFFSSLCVPANYFFTKKLLNKKTALFSSMLLSVYPIFMAISVYGNSHAPSLFFLLAGLTALLTYQEAQKRHYLILSAVCLGLMGATRLQDMAIMTIPLSYLFFIQNKKIGFTQSSVSIAKSLAIFWSIVLLTVLIFYIPAFLKQSSFDFSQSFHYQIIESFRWFFSSLLSKSLRYITSSVTPLGCLLVIFGFLFLLKKEPLKFWFCVLWFVIPFFFFGNLTFKVPRFFAVASIPLIIAQGYMLSIFLSQKTIARFCSLFIFSLLIFLTFQNIYPIVKFRHHHELLPDFYKWVAQETGPEAIIIERDNGLFIEYYGHQRVMNPPLNLYSYDPQQLELFKQDIDQALAHGVPVYITGSGLLGHSQRVEFLDFMLNHYHIIPRGRNLIEDWHRGCLVNDIGFIRLLKLVKRLP